IWMVPTRAALGLYGSTAIWPATWVVLPTAVKGEPRSTSLMAKRASEPACRISKVVVAASLPAAADGGVAPVARTPPAAGAVVAAMAGVCSASGMARIGVVTAAGCWISRQPVRATSAVSASKKDVPGRRDVVGFGWDMGRKPSLARYLAYQY